MKVIKGLHRGSFRVQGDALSLQGVIHGDLHIDSQSTVELRGMVRGNVFLNGGVLRLPGMVNGDVVNNGGTLSISGSVQGQVTTEAGGTTTHNATT